PTLLEEKRTGIESRPQESRAPVLTQRYALWLKGADAQRFRALLGQMAGMRVAVPLWNDLHEASAWGSRIHASRCSLGWTPVGDDWASLQIAENGTEPLGEWKAPLLVGRMERPALSAESDDCLEASITIREDS